MIKVITDTTCSLPQDVVKLYDIIEIPVYITFGSEVFRDIVELKPADFYKRLASAKELPITSQPSVADFKALYEDVLRRNPGATILSIHISGALSGTVESARLAAASLPDASIRIIDSQSLALGHGMMVRYAAQLAQQEECSVEVIQQNLSEVRRSMSGGLVLDTLEYLSRSGRIGRGVRLLGGLLNVKPLLMLKGGAIEPFERYRSRESALNALREMTIEAGVGKRRLQVGIMHTICEEDARALAAEVQRVLEPEALVIGEISGAIGVFIGPRALGATWSTLPA